MVMKRYTALVALMLIAFSGCDKYENTKDDLSGDLYLRGRAFVVDNVQKNGAVRHLSGKTIFIGYSSDNTVNYLFTTRADSLGYFLFENLKPDVSYNVFAEYEENGIKYFGMFDTTLKESLNSSRLFTEVSDRNQNGIIYTVTDAQGGLVKNAQLCLFSFFEAANDSNCVGSTYQLTTNEFGKAGVFNIPSVIYHSYCKASFNNTNFKGQDLMTAPLGSNQIYRDTIIVKK